MRNSTQPKKNITVLTGAGVSQESGIKTFRDSGGLWENHAVTEIATREAFKRNPALVLNFYNLRRKQLKEVEPNVAHLFIARLEDKFNVNVITQNVDDLHERAGSTNITHLHGELKKARSVKNDDIAFHYDKDIALGDLHTDGGQLRPHIVWFGEAVPEMDNAIEIVRKSDILIIIGTSLQVYPAAGLIDYAPNGIPIFVIDPSPLPNISTYKNLVHIQEKAGAGIKKLEQELEKFLKA